MTAYPDLRRSVTGVWPPRIDMVPKGVPVLGETMGYKDRNLLMGWVQTPADNWEPEELIWRPPGTKSLDGAGVVVDARAFAGSPDQWVIAQLDRRSRYLDLVKRMVLDGSLSLTASLAKMLGLPFGDAVSLQDRNPAPAPTAELARMMAKHLEARS